MKKIGIDMKYVLTFSFIITMVTACSKSAPCPTQHVAEKLAPNPARLELAPSAPPQAVSLADAKRVFAAHDCCGRYINTDFFKVGALRARGRVFTVFQFVWVNPENDHGGEGVAILDGMNLLGTYATYGTSVRLRDAQIGFECDDYSRRHHATDCNEDGFQSIDLNQPELPKTRIINGQISELSDSI